MGEDAESPKINHTFLRDYVTEGSRDESRVSHDMVVMLTRTQLTFLVT